MTKIRKELNILEIIKINFCCERSRRTRLIQFVPEFNNWCFITADGFVRASDIKYCPFCGKLLSE